ncbi:hypothetical protein [Actinokineospora sp.]|uniref:hypothetical protein n=1 Tax=Actinokineospora sp. TaxID=1872133 RepID=UPI004037F814
METTHEMPSCVLDENGHLLPISADEAMTVLTEWAMNYPTGRFAVVGMAPDGWDAAVLGWGLAQPDQVFVSLDETGVSGRYASVDRVIDLLARAGIDSRVIWVDAEPERWDDAETTD